MERIKQTIGWNVFIVNVGCIKVGYNTKIVTAVAIKMVKLQVENEIQLQ